MTRERCECCARWEAAKLIYFNDLGPVFAVCRGCAVEAGDRGALVLDLDADGNVIVNMPGGGSVSQCDATGGQG